MVEDFICEYAKNIVEYPSDVSVKSSEVGDVRELTLFANKQDLGKLIGKEGKMIGAIKTVISGCKAKETVSYRINVEAV